MKKRVVRLSLIVLAIALALVLATPFLVAHGVRAWIWWTAREQGLQCTVESIDAPFLRPVELKGIHVTGNNAVRTDLRAARVLVSLNLHSILLRGRDRAIENLVAENVDGEWRINQVGNGQSERAWNTLQNSLPERFSLTHVNLRVEDGATLVVLSDITVSGSEGETGTFSAGG